MKVKKLIFALPALALVALIGFGIYDLYDYCKNKPDFNVSDTLPDGGGKSAKVILIAGQSNAAGCSLDQYLKKSVSDEQYEEYEKGYDNVYINYFSSGSNESKGFVKCGANQGQLIGFFGPELGLSERLNEEYPDETFFIIKCAWNGTTLYRQWLSPSAGKSGLLYRHFIKYVNASLEYLKSKNYDIKIEGICWMQGESDSMSIDEAIDYERNLGCFISDLRNEFSNYASSDGIAFIDAYISDSEAWTYYTELNNSKKAVADMSEMNVVIDTISHGLSVSNEPEGEPDIYHYDALSEIKLGHLFADEVIKFFDQAD